MKKIALSIFGFFTTIASYGQSVYMHEAQQEAEESGSTGFSGIIGTLFFFGLVYLISKIWDSRKGNSRKNTYQSDDSEVDYRQHYEEIEREEAISDMEIEDIVRESERHIVGYNSLDFSPITSHNEKLVEKPKTILRFHPSTGDAFFDEIVAEQEKKFFPEGSIDDFLGALSDEDYVDLGLSVKWSSKNIGADHNYEIGYQFRWGSVDYIENYDREKSLEYSKIPYPSEIKNYEEDISGNVNYDGAYKLTNGIIRIPTKTECEELIEKCKWEYIEVGIYKGFIITGPSGKSIYLPLEYHSFVNCMHIIMMTVAEAYMSSTSDSENNYGYADKCIFALRIANKNHDTIEFEKDVITFFKESFHPIRGVVVS